uniref:BTB domain-containing protein n=1 Tax=Panagrolaimus sp. PS1159 TaxID=55785 RepID=A0AC35FUH3_9BILA
MEGILSVEKEQIRAEIDIKSPENLEEILYNREDKDFDISIATQIPIFQQFKESNQTKFVIADYDYEIIELAMKFCYGISIAENLNASIAIKLLQFSIKYQISDLKESMEEYLLKEKSPMNICEIVNASISMNSIKLREKCFDYMLECMKESKYINDLDKDFAFVLLKTSFSVFNV